MRLFPTVKMQTDTWLTCGCYRAVLNHLGAHPARNENNGMKVFKVHARIPIASLTNSQKPSPLQLKGRLAHKWAVTGGQCYNRHGWSSNYSR